MTAETRAAAPLKFPVWEYVLAAALGAIAFLLLPTGADVGHPSHSAMLAMRGVAAGCVVGLALSRPRVWWWLPAANASACAAGLLLLMRFARPALSWRALAFAWALGLVAGLVMSFVLTYVAERAPRAAQVIALSAVLAILLVVAGVLPGFATPSKRHARAAQLSAHPQPEKYAMDGWSFLRTYDLMKQGRGYHDAFAQGIIDDSRHDASAIQAPFNYREPFVFELWRILPGDSGRALWGWFVLYVALVMIAAYLLAAALVRPAAALLAPILLVSYYTYFLWASSWFLLTEVWAAGFAVAAVMCLVRGWRIPSLVFLIAAVAAREFMLILVVAWLAAWWFSDRRKETVWLPLVAIAGPVLVLLAHLWALPHTSAGLGSVTAWLHGGPERLVNALKFGYRDVPAGGLVALGVGAAALAGAAMARPRWKMAVLLSATAIPTLFLLTVSQGEWHYYWGAVYSPLAIAIAPTLLSRLMPAYALAGQPQVDRADAEASDRAGQGDAVPIQQCGDARIQTEVS